MKYPVQKSFEDKFTKKIHRQGTEYNTADLERAKFLIEKGFIKESDMGNETVELIKILDQTVSQIANAVTSEFSLGRLEQLLSLEKQDRNRKGVIEHIESLMHGEM